MPLIYIHGVRQRNKPGLERLQDRFVSMMKRVARSVSGIGDAFEVRVPYWGERAARSDYVSILPATLSKSVADELIEAVHERELGFERDPVPEDELRSKGSISAAPGCAAQATDAGEEAERLAGYVDLGALRAASLARPAAIEDLIRSLASEGLADDEIEGLDRLLREGWQVAYEKSTSPRSTPQHTSAAPSARPTQHGETQGEELPAWMSRRTLENLRGAVERAATVVALGLPSVRAWVDNAHRDFAMFTGDAMHYVLQRERSGEKGEIIATLLRELDEAGGGGPLIVITHSMGAAILYDLVTRFRTELEIDCLISVGSQVAQFQNLGLFPQEAERDARGRITGLRPRIKHWFNIYDELDLLNFVASPVFGDAVDISFSTGRGPLTAHSGYWSEPRFYDVLGDLIARSLR